MNNDFARRPPLLLRFLLAACLLFAAAQPARAQSDDAEKPASGKVKKPIIFLDKNPRIVAYQLGRLSNEQLLLVDRETTHPKFAPVFEAILGRPKFAAKIRDEALAALATINKTDATTEILAALKRLDPEKSPGVLPELAKLLLAQKTDALKKQQAALEELAGTDGPPSARQAAFAALTGIQAADALLTFAEDKPAGPEQLFLSLLLVSDAPRRAAFFPKLETLLKPDTEEALRRAAIQAAGRMNGHEPAVFTALGKLVASGTDVPVVARALLALPKDKWPAPALKELGDALLEQAKQVPDDQRTQNDFLDLTQLGTDLALKLPKEQGVPLRKAFGGLGVRVIRLGALIEQMFFDKTLIVVEVGKPFELVFENGDVMPHNWLLAQPGALDEIGAASEKMPPTPDKTGRMYVPDSPKILAATKLVNPGESTRVRVTAPATPGDFPYACTFPGHWQRMRGILKVVPDLDDYLAKAPPEPAAPVITEWKLSDLAPDLATLSQGRSLVRGKELFTSVGCIACHKVGRDGVLYGPDLTGVFPKYKGDAQAVLAEILEPSKNLEPRYRAYNFKPAGNDDPFTGFLVSEDATTLTIQTGPAENLIQKFPKKEITGREPQPSSIMPAGLLNLLTQDQILDLLAFLKSTGDTARAVEKK